MLTSSVDLEVDWLPGGDEPSWKGKPVDLAYLPPEFEGGLGGHGHVYRTWDLVPT